MITKINPTTPIEYLAPRWQHQIKGEEAAFKVFKEAREMQIPFGFGLFFEPGTGKTLTAINIMRRLMKNEGRFLRTLILCPSVVCFNWKAEIRKFSKIEARQVQILMGPSRKRYEAFKRNAFDSDNKKLPQIFITNYETFSATKRTVFGELVSLMHKWEPEILICDESHRLKDMKANRTKKIDMLANPIDGKTQLKKFRPYTLLLTGSPVLNSMMDLFSQFLILDGGETFGTNFFVFRAQYFEDKNANMPKQKYFPNWVPKKDALDQIQKRIARKSIVAYKNECLDLPPIIKQRVLLECDAEQKRHYEEMRKELITYFESDACVATMALTKSLRLMQICSGFLKMETGEEINFKENPKREAISDLLQDLAPNHKIIVWAIFKKDYETIKAVCQKLKLPLVSLHGGMSDLNRNESIKKFNEDKKVRVLIGHPRSGGIGVNLTASDYSIYYSRSFSLEDRLQSEARNYRGGSEIHKKVTHIDLVMKDTIEEKVLDILRDKKELGLGVLKDCLALG